MAAPSDAITKSSDDEFVEMEVKIAEAERLFENGDLEWFSALDFETHYPIIDKGDNDWIKKV